VQDIKIQGDKMKNSWNDNANLTALNATTNKLKEFIGIHSNTTISHDNVLEAFPVNIQNENQMPSNASTLDM